MNDQSSSIYEDFEERSISILLRSFLQKKSWKPRSLFGFQKQWKWQLNVGSIGCLVSSKAADPEPIVRSSNGIKVMKSKKNQVLCPTEKRSKQTKQIKAASMLNHVELHWVKSRACVEQTFKASWWLWIYEHIILNLEHLRILPMQISIPWVSQRLCILPRCP